MNAARYERLGQLWMTVLSHVLNKYKEQSGNDTETPWHFCFHYQFVSFSPIHVLFILWTATLFYGQRLTHCDSIMIHVDQTLLSALYLHSSFSPLHHTAIPSLYCNYRLTQIPHFTGIWLWTLPDTEIESFDIPKLNHNTKIWKRIKVRLLFYNPNTCIAIQSFLLIHINTP